MDSNCLVDLLGGQMISTATLVMGLLIATFVLEDVATVAAGILAGRMVIDPATALATVLLGTLAGDLALYAIGRWFGSTAIAASLRKKPVGVIDERLRQQGLYAVIIARFVPGARLPIFFGSGAIRLPLGTFCLALLGAALLWTPALFFASSLAGQSWLSQLTPVTMSGAVILCLAGFAAFRWISRAFSMDAKTDMRIEQHI